MRQLCLLFFTFEIWIECHSCIEPIGEFRVWAWVFEIDPKARVRATSAVGTGCDSLRRQDERGKTIPNLEFVVVDSSSCRCVI